MLIVGDAGGNRIIGTSDPDIIDSGGGLDAVHAGDGDDVILGGANRDNLFGEGGNDRIFGEGSNDKLYGGDGNDMLDGGGQDDRVYGGDGDDVIIGGNGNDVLYGDNANDGNDAEGYHDVFQFDNADGTDKVFDFEHGIDQVQLTSGGTYSLSWTPAKTASFEAGRSGEDVVRCCATIMGALLVCFQRHFGQSDPVFPGVRQSHPMLSRRSWKISRLKL